MQGVGRELIDTHFHLWELGRPECEWPTPTDSAIYRDHELSEYRAMAQGTGVSRAILVQSQEAQEDSDWLLATFADESFVGGIVGWTDLLAAAAPTVVAKLARDPKLKGLRPMVQDKEADWYDRPAFAPAARALADAGLRLDALVRVPHLGSLERLAAAMPSLPIVIDHAAKPRIGSDSGLELWYEEIAPLSQHATVYCKLSGLLTECPAGADHTDLLAPYVAALLGLFGADRLMWGSDWPVLNLAGNYAGWLGIARELVPGAVHDAVFAATARSFYGLDEVEG